MAALSSVALFFVSLHILQTLFMYPNLYFLIRDIFGSSAKWITISEYLRILCGIGFRRFWLCTSLVS
jgi:hypothetical protein